MTIVMENFKATVKVSAFGVFNVDLKTFTTICNAALSLYALLKRF
jgi:hypothetical protein